MQFESAWCTCCRLMHLDASWCLHFGIREQLLRRWKLAKNLFDLFMVDCCNLSQRWIKLDAARINLMQLDSLCRKGWSRLMQLMITKQSNIHEQCIHIHNSLDYRTTIVSICFVSFYSTLSICQLVIYIIIFFLRILAQKQTIFRFVAIMHSIWLIQMLIIIHI